jgi:hypothetical protein
MNCRLGDQGQGERRHKAKDGKQKRQGNSRKTHEGRTDKKG